MAELPVFRISNLRRFEMPNLLKFAMGKLCYDLALEVIDELDPTDVPELMKVDRRFRGILLQKPTRIFGKQVHSIDISIDMTKGENWDDPTSIIRVTKFPGSTPLYSDVFLLAQVERCSSLNISPAGDGIDEKELLTLKKIFANLKQVDELDMWIIDGKDFNDSLVNLKAEVTDRALLKVYPRKDEVKQELWSSLIGGRLQNCRRISLAVADLYPAVYSALSKTQLELFVTQLFVENVVSAIELILNSGIPSGNKEAACFVRLLRDEMAVEINNLIKNFPEIRDVNERNKTFIRDTMMETLRKHGTMFSYSLGNPDSLENPIHCYWIRIDENRDCIYAVNDKFFFAKYVSSIQ